MPASGGLKLAVPERPVVYVLGDEPSMYWVKALWSASQYETAVTFVVVNNRGFSILKAFRDVIGAGEEVPRTDLPGVNLAGIARDLGREGEAAEEAKHLRDALKRTLSAGRPYLEDVWPWSVRC
jgi:benzoylformate decarboxylase